MFGDLQIVIPSRSRATKQKTYLNLARNLWPYITIVVPKEQCEEYRCVVSSEIMIVEFEGGRIPQKRDFILSSRETGKVIMMDDDLTFYKRTVSGTFLFADPADTIFLIDDL